MSVWLLCFPACFVSAFGTFDLVFMIYKPDFKCDIRNVTSSLNDTGYIFCEKEKIDDITYLHRKFLTKFRFKLSIHFCPTCDLKRPMY